MELGQFLLITVSKGTSEGATLKIFDDFQKISAARSFL